MSDDLEQEFKKAYEYLPKELRYEDVEATHWVKISNATLYEPEEWDDKTEIVSFDYPLDDSDDLAYCLDEFLDLDSAHSEQEVIEKLHSIGKNGLENKLYDFALNYFKDKAIEYFEHYLADEYFEYYNPDWDDYPYDYD